MDEAKLFDRVKVNFELRPDNLNAFSKVDNVVVSMLANIAMIIAFLGIMYILFPVLRQSVFGFKHR